VSARPRTLVARLDNDGDVLLAGPAIRAVAARADVVLLCGPRGEQAARLLPGVAELLVWRAPWIDPEPDPVDRGDVEGLVERLRAARVDEAIVMTSFHQSPLPLALLLRLAGVPRVSAISVDYPGSLLDVRHRLDDDQPEVHRGLSLAAAAGYPQPGGDPGTLAVRRPLPDVAHLGLPARGSYVVVHPGGTAPARRWPPQRCAEAVAALVADGWPVVVTGAPDEAELAAAVVRAAGGDDGGSVTDLGGRTSYAELAAVLDGAAATVVGNTGPAHLSAAVGTPVVSLFSPVVPAVRWAPYGVPTVLLGDQDAPCKNTRARECPVPGHPCLDGVSAAEVVAAVDKLTGGGR
jgi:ADP-heptose:LPS heptosyltransferase